MIKVLSKWLILIPLALAPISINAYPRVLTVRDQLRVTIRVEPDPRNRQLILEWWVVEGFENRKFVPIDATIFQYWLWLDTQGDWTIRATVLRNDNSRASAVTTARVP